MVKVLGDRAMDFLVAGIVIAVGLLILEGFKNNITDTNSAALTGINKTIDAVNVFPDWMGTIALVIVAAVVLAYVTGFGRQG